MSIVVDINSSSTGYEEFLWWQKWVWCPVLGSWLCFVCFLLKVMLSLVGGNIICYLVIEIYFEWSTWISLLWHCICACCFLAYKVSIFIKVSCYTTCDTCDIVCSVYLYGSPYYSCTVMKQVGLCGNILIYVWEVPGSQVP